VTDIIYIKGLKTETVIGVYDWERDIRQTVVLDIEMAVNAASAGATDDVVDALDYAAVSERVLEYVHASHYKLIETLAERVAELVMNEFGVPWLHLRLSKPGAVKAADDVGVVIERGVKP
jgi:dihydroneopterin aldolase